MGTKGDPGQLLALLRELKGLEGRRKAEGLTPLEYQRWLDLRKRMGKRVESAGGDSDPGKIRVRMRVEFRDPDAFGRAWIRHLARGGIFVATPFAATMGTELELRIRIESSAEELLVPAVVASENVGEGFSTAALGMAVHFRPLPAASKAALDDLLVRCGKLEKADAAP